MALAAIQNSNVIVEQSVFTDNESETNAGAGLWLRDSTLVVRCCFFARNAANNGSGIYADDGTQCLIEDCEFVDNSAIFGGAGVTISGPERFRAGERHPSPATEHAGCHQLTPLAAAPNPTVCRRTAPSFPPSARQDTALTTQRT